MLDTMWKGGDTTLRYEKSRAAAERWWEEQKKVHSPEQLNESVEQANGSALSQGVPHLPPPESSPDPETSVSMPTPRRSPRKAGSGNQASLKGLKDRINENLPNGVPRMESRR